MPRYGIKVWSKDVLKNPDFFNEAAVAVKNGTFGYIELLQFRTVSMKPNL